MDNQKIDFAVCAPRGADGQPRMRAMDRRELEALMAEQLNVRDERIGALTGGTRVTRQACEDAQQWLDLQLRLLHEQEAMVVRETLAAMDRRDLEELMAEHLNV